MKKLILTAMVFLTIGVGCIAGGSSMAPSTWQAVLLVIGGIMVGVCASFLTLARLSEDNPAIVTELERLDKKS